MNTPNSWPGFIWQSLQGNSVAFLAVFVACFIVYLWACPKAPADVSDRLSRLEVQITKVQELETVVNASDKKLDVLQEKLTSLRESYAEQKLILKEIRHELLEAFKK